MKDVFYCKECETSFEIDITSLTGDYMLQCPTCNKRHYRYFQRGLALHCDIEKRASNAVKIIKGV